MLIRFLIILLCFNFLFPTSNSINFNPLNKDLIIFEIGNKYAINPEDRYYNIGASIPFISDTWPEEGSIFRKLFQNIQFGLMYTEQKSIISDEEYNSYLDVTPVRANIKGRQAFLNISFPSFISQIHLNLGYSFNFSKDSLNINYGIEFEEMLDGLKSINSEQTYIKNTAHLGFYFKTLENNNQSVPSLYFGIYKYKIIEKQIITTNYSDSPSYTVSYNYPELNGYGLELNHHFIINDKISLCLKYLCNLERLDYEYSFATYFYL